LEAGEDDLGRIAFKRDNKDFDIKVVVSDILMMSQNLIKNNQIEIKTKFSKTLPTPNCNKRTIRQIIDNLLTNAVKYSPRNSEVQIVVKYLNNKNSQTNQKPQIHIQIKDQGIGMSEEEIKIALSGKGTTIDKSALDKPIDSHGIGLPLVQRMVDEIEAKMEIESEKGKGTTIKLWFDIANNNSNDKSEPEIIDQSSVDKDNVDNNGNNNYDKDNKHNQDNQDSKDNKEGKRNNYNSNNNSDNNNIDNNHNKDNQNKTILIADDEEVNLIVLERPLIKSGYKVITAKNGKEVLEILQTQHCDLIFMDNAMPIIDGIQATKIIREGKLFTNNNNNSIPNPKQIPIIAYSGNSDQESKNQAMEAGMDDYLGKPFCASEALGLVRKYVWG
jgi:CheY-like chemotaxis protein/anti-sigma regulatory factor (Ser/Thr protein kinase)